MQEKVVSVETYILHTSCKHSIMLWEPWKNPSIKPVRLDSITLFGLCGGCFLFPECISQTLVHLAASWH